MKRGLMIGIVVVIIIVISLGIYFYNPAKTEDCVSGGEVVCNETPESECKEGKCVEKQECATDNECYLRYDFKSCSGCDPLQDENWKCLNREEIKDYKYPSERYFPGEIQPDCAQCFVSPTMIATCQCDGGECEKVSKSCAQEGENVCHETPEIKCCEGLATPPNGDMDFINGECVPIMDCAKCINCGDDICGTGENQCNCPEDCA